MDKDADFVSVNVKMEWDKVAAKLKEAKVAKEIKEQINEISIPNR